MEPEPRYFRDAQQAAKRRDRATAFRLMREVVLANPSFVPAWLELSQLVDQPAQQRECLERALALQPSNQAARESLEQLRIKELLANISILAAPAERPAQKLGAHLVELGVVTEQQVRQALAEQRARHARGQRIQFGELLLELDLITPDLLAQTLVRQQDRRGVQDQPFQRLGAYLVAERVITAEQLVAALAEQMRLRRLGIPILLGQVLLEMQCVSLEILEQILERQRAEFFSAFGD